MDNILWNKVVEFHGHACPGLAIGFQASLLVKEILEINNNIGDEDIVCIAETDACGVDAVQVILKATIGTGSLRIDYKGKQAFNFFNRKNGKSCRIVLNNLDKKPTKEENMNYILSQNPLNIFTIKNTNMDFPNKANIYNSYICKICGEKTAENAVHIFCSVRESSLLPLLPEE